MREYKLLLTGIMIGLALVFISVFFWLWSSNGKNTDPLPIMVNENASAHTQDNEPSLVNNTLYIQAEDTLQTALDDLIVRFESRFPRVDVLVNYVPTKALLSLNARQNERADTTQFDLIMAEGKLSEAQLAPLQFKLNDPKKRIQIKGVNHNQNDDRDNISTQSADHGNLEARQLTTFSYAIKHSETIDGVILTDNPIAATFRNYILSSAGQDILNKYDYDTIDDYQNSIDDLFNPSSRAKKADADSESVKIADTFNAH